MLFFLSLLLAAVLLISVLKPSLNAGIPALLLSLFFAPLLGTENVGTVASLFPSSLFLTLLGVTLFFSTLYNSGLIEIVLERILVFLRLFPRFVPALLFLLVALLTAVGLGNIASIALIAPIAIPLSRELGFSPFLMTLLLVGGANAASFSPLTLPGVFTNDFIEKSSSLSAKMNPQTMRWWIFWLVFIVISVSTAVSFYVLGGRRGLKKNMPTENLSERTSDLADKKNVGTLDPQMKRTAIITAIVSVIFILGCVAGLDIWSDKIPEQLLTVLRRAGDVGFIGWLGSVLLLVSGNSKTEKSLKDVPWSTIILVCGMSTYIELLSRMGLPQVISSTVQRNIPDFFIPSGFAAGSALLSAFSSSVGVALPVFMPIVDSLSKTGDAILSQTLVVSVAAGSHLVDASPLSTLGALCIAQIKTTAEQQSSYRQLLIFSFCMIPVSAVWAILLRLVFDALN